MNFFFPINDEGNIVLLKPFLTNKKLSIMGQNFANSYSIEIFLRTRVIDHNLEFDPLCVYV
jgi:hypothetical protein